MEFLMYILFAVFLVLFYIRATKGFLVNEKRRPLFIFELILLLGATIYSLPVVYNDVVNDISMARLSPMTAMRVLLVVIAVFILCSGVKLLLKKRGE